MKVVIWHIAPGLESRFSWTSPYWIYRSRFDRWFIIRLFGIYFWFFLKEHRIG